MTNQTPDTEMLIHTCEVCGLVKTMTPEEGFNEGWDYPPRMGAFGVLSGRTCGSCPINKTLWWRLTVDKVDPATLTAADLALIEKVQNEPLSITPPTPTEQDVDTR